MADATAAPTCSVTAPVELTPARSAARHAAHLHALTSAEPPDQEVP